MVNVLLAVAAASALASLILCGLYVAKAKQLRTLQSQQALVHYRSAVYNQLANDVLEYGKTHSAISPLIDKYLKPKTEAPAANTKPTTR